MNWTLFAQFSLVTAVGGVAGLLLSNAIYSRVLNERWKDMAQQIKATESVIKENSKLCHYLSGFQEAARPIVRELEQVGDVVDWKNGAETARMYYWHEIEPLWKALVVSEGEANAKTPH